MHQSKKMSSGFIIIVQLLMILLPIIQCREVTISNVIPRRDTDGNIMDAHDGSMFLHDGLYYYYGPSYGLCKEPPGPSGCTVWHPGGCGFQLNHNVSLYTSTDLVTWTFRGYAFQMASMKTPGIMFCPRVLPNAKTKKWVMWFNFLPATGTGVSQSQYAVAVSDTPEGPFQLVTEKVTTLAWENTGDANLFQDDNGDGYIIYTSHIDGSIYNPSHLMSIEKLSDDYLSSLGKEFNTGFFGQNFVEAPAMFKRHSIYYAVFGQCCCYCAEGSAVTVYNSTSPLGPYGTMNSLGNEGHAQQYNILKYKTSGSEPYGYLWQGDRWQTSPDGAKGHDFTYWSPMVFNDDGSINFFAVTWGIPTVDQQLNDQWASFKQIYTKQYASIAEEKARRMVWETNLNRILQHNAEAKLGLHTYILGMNQFGDLTHSEFRQRMNIGKATMATRRQHQMNVDPFHAPSNTHVPRSLGNNHVDELERIISMHRFLLDWRTQGYVTPVKDQGACGSSWAFAAIGALEGQHFVQTKDKLVPLSAQNLVDCSDSFGNAGCNGGMIDFAYQYIKVNGGIDTEESYPYEGHQGSCRFNRSNIGANSTGFRDIQSQSEAALAYATAIIGPISVFIDSSHPSFQFYRSGVYDEPNCSSTNLDHCALVVGFNVTDTQQYYIVKNSWGTSWGIDGYIWMVRNKNNRCGIATMASYPTVYH